MNRSADYGLTGGLSSILGWFCMAIKGKAPESVIHPCLDPFWFSA